MPKRNGSGIALLADETRRRIIALLAQRPMRSSAIAREIGLSRPATSRQIGLLYRAGLLRARLSMVDRRGYVYSLNPELSGRIIAWLAGTEVGLDRARAGSHDTKPGYPYEWIPLPPESGSRDRSA